MALPRDPTEDGAADFISPNDFQNTSLTNVREDDPVVRRYSRFFRKTHIIIQKIFSDLECYDERQTPFRVPCIVGTVEAAIAVMFGDTSTYGQATSGQFRKVRVPLATLVPGSPSFDQSRYTYERATFKGMPITVKRARDTRLTFTRGIPITLNYDLVVWTRYMEDAVQIMEQILQKLLPEYEFHMPENAFPSNIRMSADIQTNFGDEKQPGELKIFKIQCPMTVLTYLPQNFIRNKTVLDVTIDVGIGDIDDQDDFQSLGQQTQSAAPYQEPKPQFGDQS